MNYIELKNISKKFSNNQVLKNINLNVKSSEFLVLVGPSGCGKSTLLRTIAGLETPDSGDVIIAGVRVNSVQPQDRNLAMVFQSYALYPHLSVYDNLAFSLKLKKVSDTEIKKQVLETAHFLQIESFLDRKPKALSGGQRQRVALGRALVKRPPLILFDEPLSNLDAHLRQQMRLEIKRIHQQMNCTVIYVTHDQVEATTMGDRIVVMKQGEIIQVDQPTKIYESPQNTFVAGFIGSPEINILSGEFNNLKMNNIEIGIRPEYLRIQEKAGYQNTGTAVINYIENLGSHNLYHLTQNDVKIRVLQSPVEGASVGQKIPLYVKAEKIIRFDAQTKMRLQD
ncbi:MAG: ABC transporter ATP-binding protein [Bdellovibrionota bacterium]